MLFLERMVKWALYLKLVQYGGIIHASCEKNFVPRHFE